MRSPRPNWGSRKPLLKRDAAVLAERIRAVPDLSARPYQAGRVHWAVEVSDSRAEGVVLKVCWCEADWNIFEKAVLDAELPF